MTQQPFDFSYEKADDDNAMRCVLDVVCINDPNERNIRFQGMNKDFETIKNQAEKLLKETPDEVKEILTTFTKIVQKIKNSREKLQSLKTRMRVVKNTFSPSVDNVDSDIRIYLKSKECVSLMRKISSVVESTQLISSAIADKKFVEAADIVSQTQNYLKHDLCDIDAINNCRMDLETNISVLYKSILNEIISLIFDETYLDLPGPRVISIFQNFESFPIPSATETYGVWKSRHDELLDELVKALKTINKLKIGLAFMIKSFKCELDKTTVKIMGKIITNMPNNSVISCGAETSAHYNKKALNILLSAATKMMDIVQQKGEFLAKCFDKHLEGYDTDWAEYADETLPEADSHALRYRVNQTINLAMKSLFRGYLTYTDKNKEEIQPGSCLSTSALHNVFSFKQRLLTSSKKDYLYKFGATSFEIDSGFDNVYGANVLNDQSLAPLFEPSVKYFKHIYLPLITFVHQVGGFYVDIKLENPLSTFLESFYTNHFSHYSIQTINTLSCIDKYSKNDKFCDINQEEIIPLFPDQPLLNISICFYRAVACIYRFIRCIPTHTVDYVKQYHNIFFDGIVKRFIQTLNKIIVTTEGITLMSSQISNSISKNHLKSLFDIFNESTTHQLPKAHTLFLQNIEKTLALALENCFLIDQHIAGRANFKLLISLYDNSVFLSNIVKNFRIFVISIKTFTFDHELNASHSAKLRSKINISLVLKQLVFDSIPDDIDLKLGDVETEITEFANKCFVMIFFEIRFHVAIYLQILFQIPDPEPDFIHSNIFHLSKYIKEFKDNIPSQSLNKFCEFIFHFLPKFIQHYLFQKAKQDSDIKIRAPFLRRCIYMLNTQLIDVPYIDARVMNQTLSFFDLYDMNFDEIIKAVVDNGPLFSFETYSIAINSVKSPSLSTDQFNLKMKQLKQCFPSDS